MPSELWMYNMYLSIYHIFTALHLRQRMKSLLVMILFMIVACAGPDQLSIQADVPVPQVEFPPTNRPDVRGISGAVSSDHPLASAVGLDVLRRGGNATDAAVAMAAVLAVVRPHMNGVGGDAFALFYDGESGEITAMNGSGRAGALATPEFFGETTTVPQSGPLSVSVPGTVAAWEDALDAHGTMTLEELLIPAIRYASEGFPVSTRLQSDIQGGQRGLNEAAQAIYLPDGELPPVGSLLKNPALGATLQAIALEGKSAFYTGAIATHLSDFLESEGGYLRADDLATHQSTWVTPLSAEYMGHEFFVLPPNTQGIAQLQLFEMAKYVDLPTTDPMDEGYLHSLIELKKVAFADRDRWVADPEFVDLPIMELMAPGYLEGRATLITDRAAESVHPGIGDRIGPDEDPDDSGDTVYLTVVDQWGNGVSWIQSLFATFGSGLLEPETGIVLQNRGALFSLIPEHPNVVAPGKRPYHTLTPMLATQNGSLAFTIGTPGGDSQTQSLLQIVNNLLMFGMTPQEAIEAPRFRSNDGLSLSLEDRFGGDLTSALSARGHDITIIHGWTATFGGAQMIRIEGVDRTLTVASDPRREAYGLAY